MKIQTHLSHRSPSAFRTHFIFKPAHFSHAEFLGCLTLFLLDSGVSGTGCDSPAAISAAGCCGGGGGGIDGVSMVVVFFRVGWKATW